MDENKQAEPVGEIQIEDMGQPFNAMRVRVHFYKEVPQVGAKIYTKAPAVAVNEELLKHLKSAHAFIEETAAFGKQAKKGILQCGESIWYIDKSKEAIAAAEAATGVADAITKAINTGRN